MVCYVGYRFSDIFYIYFLVLNAACLRNSVKNKGNTRNQKDRSPKKKKTPRQYLVQAVSATQSFRSSWSWGNTKLIQLMITKGTVYVLYYLTF